MLEFTEERRTLQTCNAEGGTGGPEKTHLWVKGSHSVFHSQRAIGFSSAAHESTELSICFLWRRWGCAQSLSMTYRVYGECSCALLAEHRGKGSSTGLPTPLPWLPCDPGPVLIVPPPPCLSTLSTWASSMIFLLKHTFDCQHLNFRCFGVFGVFWMSSATGEN